MILDGATQANHYGVSAYDGGLGQAWTVSALAGQRDGCEEDTRPHPDPNWLREAQAGEGAGGPAYLRLNKNGLHITPSLKGEGKYSKPGHSQ